MELIAVILIIVFVGIILFVYLEYISESDSDKQKRDVSMDEIKYNGYMYKCPMCGSNKIKTISTLKRAASIGLVGLASKNIGKLYECDKCKYKW